MANKSITKELYLKDYTFNLKSKSTGKYSVHDSYRDNYSDGFLVKVNAPADVNQALKDIYYATEKGVIVSYKDFNGKIVSIRKNLLAKNFPGKELKDLTKEERIKIETESAKHVLRDLSINETTKLIYSPELTEAKQEAEANDLRIKFIPEEVKVIFHDSEDKEKEMLVKAYLEFSEKIKPLVDNAVNSYNLDELELTVLTVDRIYHNLMDNFRENVDIKDFYNQSNARMALSIQEMKSRQEELENNLNNKVSEILDKKDFKNLKSLINKIENDFIENKTISNDPKSNSIKDLAVNQLKNIGKIIALSSLDTWGSSNFKIADNLLTQNLNSDLESILKNKYAQEEEKRRIEEEKLVQISFDDTNKVYERFVSLINKPDLFVKLFELITAESYENIEKLILENDNSFGFIILLSNNLPLEKSEKLWKNFNDEIKTKISTRSFPYYSLNSNGMKNIFFELTAERSPNEILDSIFSNIKAGVLRNLDNLILAKNLFKLSQFDFSIDNVLKKLAPEKLLKLLKVDIIKTNEYLKSAVIHILIRWLPNLDINSSEFNNILLNYPELGVYKIKNSQLEKLEKEVVFEILEKLDNKKEALHYFMLRIGQKRFDEALKIRLKRLTENEPDNFENHYNLGLSFFKEQEFDKAVSELKTCIGINPESHLAHYTLGYMYDQKGNYDLAIPEYKKAIQLKYGYIEAYYNLGIIYNRMKDYYMASQQFKKILKIEPDHYNSVINLGFTYEELKEIEQAKKEYFKAIEIDPKKADAYMSLATMYSSQGLLDEAVEMYSKALDYDLNNPTLHYNIGLIYHQQKKYSLAKAHYKTSIKYDNKNSQVYNNLGLVYFVSVKVPQAIEMWKKAIELDNNIDAYSNLGWAYCIEQQFDKSIETYEKAKALDPEYATLYINLGTVYYRIGEYKKAATELQKYLEFEESSEKKFEVMKIIQDIKKI